MVFSYYPYEIIINKKFAREQKVDWQTRKKEIFKILMELSSKKLFKEADSDKEEYNIAEGYKENTESICFFPLNEEVEVIKIKSINEENNRFIEEELNEQNISNKSFTGFFKIGLIKHENLSIFEEGDEKHLWSYTQHKKHSGLLYKTEFGIFVSDELEKIFLIKEFGDNYVAPIAFLYYLEKKSRTYRTLRLQNSFKILPITKDRDFDINDIANLLSLEFSIRGDLLREYRRRFGRTSAFSNLLSIRRIFKAERKVNISINFTERGSEDALNLFNDLFSSFSALQGEEIEKIFSHFKIIYESTSQNRDVPVNFKRENLQKYEIENKEEEDFTDLLDAFNWIKGEINNG